MKWWPWGRDDRQERVERDSEEAGITMQQVAQRLENVATRLERMIDDKAVNENG